MTEYGRSSGSEPWHPEDPLYGDGGWGGQQAHAGQQSPYGGQPQQHPEQQPQQQYGDWGHGQQATYGQAPQQYQQYGGQGNYSYEGHGHQPYDGQNHQSYDGYGHQPYGDQGRQYTDQNHQQYQGGGWDTGTQTHGQVPYPTDPVDPYGGQNAQYGGDQSDYYGTSDAYPPPEPPARRRAEPEPEQTDWDPGPDQGEHAFFAGGNDEDDEDSEGPGDRGSRKGKAGKGGKGGKSGKDGKKGRSGLACLVVVLVLGGGVGGAGYFGYQFYQNRFGAAPDYAGDGTSDTVTVTIPKGAFGSAIGQALKKAGVVKSVDAFVAAQQENPNGGNIQAGVYVLNKQMSAASAIELMLDPKSHNNLVVAEGRRNAEVYELIDKRLKVKAGTTAAVAKKEWSTLGLPEWANDNKDIKDPLEGFLYPSAYPVSKGMKPKDVLKEMVQFSKEKYEDLGLENKAEKLDLDSPLQVLTVASLVQAEGYSKDDFEKVARVVYNRLKRDNTETYGLLDFDSTVNYLRGESKLATGSVNQLRAINDPYNTYKIKGLPPGPIANPGEVAIKAALNPAKGDWYYFVSISKDKTLFAVTNEEHNRNREQYLKEQNG
ncbi:endolytic transglycosylase MltG [Streptomyces phyllanthi]|uniref:Endolytic murein transglycosylase n=1 Tax=Streptomyces phyllanthi TaxID=1803180 RepID=A0A5N8W893_9ACTN|nr:endolytic transglycosylase MltG [Streptomyces phyllanthi]MPY43559.1 endolytic transglycosylase MltG [Streptomyces phyllanthi]